MMLACGAFVISEKITPNAYLRPGIDYVEVASPNELHEAVKYYLNNDAARMRIANSGRMRILEVLESKKIFQELINDIDSNKYSKFSVGRGAGVLNSIEMIGKLWSVMRNLLRRLR